MVKFLSIQGVLDYLAHMLASFTRINSYAVPVRIRRGIRRRVVYNDMDIDSLVRHCANADQEQRFGFYKRIADVCLFISGVFPEFASPAIRYSVPRLGCARRCRTAHGAAMSDYEVQGSQFYALAEEHESAQQPGALRVSSACSGTTSPPPASPSASSPPITCTGPGPGSSARPV